MKPRDLASWLSKHDSLPWTQAALRQVLSTTFEGSDRVAPVRQWTRTTGMDLVELASNIHAAFTEDADDTEGLCRYRVVLVDADDEVRARKEFNVYGEKITEKSGVAEPATQSGLIMMMMRHIEAQAKSALEKDRILVTSQAQTVGALKEILALTSARCTTLEDGRIQAIVSMEEMHSLKAERDIAARRLEVDLNYKAATYEKLAPAIPFVLNKLLSRDILPTDKGAFDGVTELILSLKNEQIAELKKTLTPEQMFAFVKLWEAVAKNVDERTKKEAAAKAEREKTQNGAANTVPGES
jgi:hypothetical protein